MDTCAAAMYFLLDNLLSLQRPSGFYKYSHRNFKSILKLKLNRLHTFTL